jgi:hypothetical protein
MISAADWTRFNEHYARRVRELHFDDQAVGSEFQRLRLLFDQVARTRTTLILFPNLHKLVWLASSAASLQVASIFMQNTVRHLVIKLPGAVPTSFFVEDITLRMPKITFLDIRSHQSVINVKSELTKLLNGLTELKKIILPQFYVTAEILELLSRLPHLGVIEFEYVAEQGGGQPEDVISIQPSFAPDSFRNLWNLALTARLPDMTRIFSTNFAPTNLTTLYINSLGSGLQHMVTPTVLHEFLTVVASECQLLTQLVLDLLTTLNPPELPEENAQFTLETLRPILSCPSLVAFEIVHEYPIRLSDDDIEEISRGWPNLEKLYLSCEPVAMLDATREEGALSLKALEHLARYSPNVQEIGLFLDASPDVDGAKNHDLPCFRRLRRLFVGVSRASDEEGVALYLARMLPLGCLPEYGVTWYNGPASFASTASNEMEGKMQEITRRCDSWEHIADLLPVLIRLRCEEIQRQRKLESELRTLRNQKIPNELLSDGSGDLPAKTSNKESRDSCIIA